MEDQQLFRGVALRRFSRTHGHVAPQQIKIGAGLERTVQLLQVQTILSHDTNVSRHLLGSSKMFGKKY